jgi:hypothetical protein
MDIVDRLNAVREGMESGLDDWPTISHIYEYKTAAEEITHLRAFKAECESIMGVSKSLAENQLSDDEGMIYDFEDAVRALSDEILSFGMDKGVLERALRKAYVAGERKK